MAVREALLAILTLGPAYGLQLHSELCSRAPHRAKTNVGQIYGTLERLTNARLVVRSGETADGLPLYVLTDAGSREAQSWLRGDAVVTATDWPEFLDHVLVARSLSDDLLEVVLGVYESVLTASDGLTKERTRSGADVFAAANWHFKNAALAWLGDIRHDLGARSTKAHFKIGAAREDVESHVDSEVDVDANAGADTVPRDPVPHGYLAVRPKRGRPLRS